MVGGVSTEKKGPNRGGAGSGSKPVDINKLIRTALIKIARFLCRS
jgi:hypothetical protein